MGALRLHKIPTLVSVSLGPGLSNMFPPTSTCSLPST